MDQQGIIDTRMDEFLFVIAIVSLLFFFMAGFFIILIYKNYKVRAERDREILEAVFNTQEEERNRISIDLHDDIGLGLNAIKMHTSALLEDTDRNVLISNIKENKEMVDTLITRIREIVRAQSTTFVYANGIEAELLNLYGRVCAKREIQFTHDIKLDGVPLLKEFQLNHFRICQELLHNAIKHSDCTSIEIRMLVTSGTLDYYYSDNGKGADMPKSHITGIGLQNIKSRAERYGGKTDFETSPGNGFSCTILYPVKKVREVL